MIQPNIGAYTDLHIDTNTHRPIDINTPNTTCTASEPMLSSQNIYIDYSQIIRTRYNEWCTKGATDACMCGNLDLVTAIHKYNSIRIMDKNGNLFSLVCKRGHLHIAKWLYAEYQNDFNSNGYINGFIYAWNN